MASSRRSSSSHAGAQKPPDPGARALQAGSPRGELRQPLLPEPRALEIGAEPVELLERRVDAGLDGELAQQPAGEPVDGADGRVVQRVERRLDRRRRGRARRSAVRKPLELLADALAQLAGRLLREGDGGDGAHVAGAALGIEHAAHVALDEHARLARACAGLEQERGAQVAGDAVPDVLVADGPVRHRRRPWPPGPAEPPRGRTRGAPACALAPTPRRRTRRRRRSTRSGPRVVRGKNPSSMSASAPPTSARRRDWAASSLTGSTRSSNPPRRVTSRYRQVTDSGSARSGAERRPSLADGQLVHGELDAQALLEARLLRRPRARLVVDDAGAGRRQVHPVEAAGETDPPSSLELQVDRDVVLLPEAPFHTLWPPV